MDTRQKQVEQFHRKYQKPVAEPLTSHDRPEATHHLGILGSRLTQMAKGIHELAAHLTDTFGDDRLWRFHLMLGELGEAGTALAQGDEVELADALGDLSYTVDGTAVTFDLDMDAICGEIHKSNMTKALELRPKGPDYVPPDLRTVIDKSRAQREWEQQLTDDRLQGMDLEPIWDAWEFLMRYGDAATMEKESRIRTIPTKGELEAAGMKALARVPAYMVGKVDQYVQALMGFYGL